MKLEPSRFSSHCMLIAVLALVAGIAVTVEVAAQQVGIRTFVAERAPITIVTMLPREETSARSPRSDAPALPEYFPGEI